MEKFIIRKKTSGYFHFDFMDSNGYTILSSGGYTRRFMCIKGIKSVRLSSQDDSKFKRKTTSNSRTYFNLKAFNGKVIGISNVFNNERSCDKGIKLLKTKAPLACIEDESKK
jgi:uncharacterized protein YegP (UPF0339 family)